MNPFNARTMAVRLLEDIRALSASCRKKRQHLLVFDARSRCAESFLCKMLGWGSTEDLSQNLWYFAIALPWGFFFLHWTVGRLRS